MWIFEWEAFFDFLFSSLQSSPCSYNSGSRSWLNFSSVERLWLWGFLEGLHLKIDSSWWPHPPGGSCDDVRYRRWSAGQMCQIFHQVLESGSFLDGKLVVCLKMGILLSWRVVFEETTNEFRQIYGLSQGCYSSRWNFPEILETPHRHSLTDECLHPVLLEKFLLATKLEIKKA